MYKLIKLNDTDYIVVSTKKDKPDKVVASTTRSKGILHLSLKRIEELLAARTFTAKDMEAMYLLGQQVGVNQLLSRRGELVNHHMEQANYEAPTFEEIIFPKSGLELVFDGQGKFKLK